MLTLYSFALLLALVLGSPWWLFRMATSGKYREGLSERLGRIPARIRAIAAANRVIWVHAVSVGEVLAASRLIEEMTQRLCGDSEDNPAVPPWQVLISTTTRTGQNLARDRFGSGRVFYFPLDFAWAVRAWLRVLRPHMLVLLETEFWPRLLVECRRADIPVVVVNARISDRSWPRYRRLAWLWKPLLGGLTATLAQGELDARRLKALGAGNISVAGNLKYDIRATSPAPVTTLLASFLHPQARVLVCGSTLPGEEDLLLEALVPGSVTILAPRHPERFGGVAQLLRGRGVRWIARSEWADAPEPIEPGTVFLLDSIGELASVYSLAQAAFVGGSLVAGGGHNPLEPAQFGIPVLMGPSYQNFRGIVEKLQEHEAIRIVQPPELCGALADALGGSRESRAMGERARQVFESEAGATQRCLQALLNILEVRS